MAAGVECIVEKAHPDSLTDPVRKQSGDGATSNRRVKRDRPIGSPEPTSSTPAASTSAEGLSLNATSTFFDIGTGLDSKIMGPASTAALFKWLSQKSPGGPQPSHPPWQDELPSEEYRIPSDVDPSIIQLPPTSEITQALDAYLCTFHLLWPVLDEAPLRQAAAASNHDPIVKAMLFAVCSLGFSARVHTDDPLRADTMLQATWHLFPSLLSRPYRATVQTLILMGLAMRVRNKDGVCSMLVGIAIRIAHSMGAHLQRPGPHASIDSRIWFTLYSLDKIAGFEAGRPSAIRDSDCSVSLDVSQNERTFIVGGVRIDLLGTMTRLCRHVSTISRSLFAQGVLKLSVEETLQRIGEADKILQEFAQGEQLEIMLAQEAVPSNTILPLVLPIYAMFHLAMMTVHRLSLLNHAQLVAPFLDKPLVRPYADRLRSSKSLCLNSARLALSSLEQVRFSTWPRFWTLHPFFASTLTLMIGVWQDSSSWQAKADMQILDQVSQFSADLYRECGFPLSFTSVLPRLSQMTKAIVTGQLVPNFGQDASGLGLEDSRTGGRAKSEKSKVAESSVAPGDLDVEDGGGVQQDEDLPEVDIVGWQAMLQDVLGDGAPLYLSDMQDEVVHEPSAQVAEDLRQLFDSA
ncbi:hypothetical protein ACM66B_004148 [Microbotryomycetes sp. NB124-2]